MPLCVKNTIMVGKEGQHNPLGGPTWMQGGEHDDLLPNPKSSRSSYIDEEHWSLGKDHRVPQPNRK